MANWNKIGSRGSVDDRRGSGSMLAYGGGGLGITGLLVYALLTYLGGGDITDVVSQIDPSQIQYQGDTSAYEGADEYEVFASTVLGSTNDVWSQIFSKKNETYTPPKFVLFRGITASSCGNASAQIGPHYCPLDETIYLDETFFDELQSRFGAGSADVAQAYVIAHEVGHHVQNELGTIDTVMRDAEQNPDGANALSVRQELQADCFAGIWAYSLRDREIFAQDEIQEAIDAAAAVGDDRIQEKTTGRINPESWTHGSSEARAAAFNKGFASGSYEQCSL